MTARPRPLPPGETVPHGEDRVHTYNNDGLSVKGVTVRFGGLVAVSNVTLAAPRGQITGLIGPNGAGKTTTFNACSGLNNPSEGRVYLHGTDVSSKPPAVRARMGLGRTFQLMELFDSLTVIQNVGLGLESSLAGTRPLRHIIAGRGEDKRVRETAEWALDMCGISHLANRRPGDLSTGQRRLVELARCAAGRFSLLLLDEPSSGLDPSETESFGEVLRGLVADGTTGILIVEHDMALVMKITDYNYVLDFGKIIFEGTPTEVGQSDEVRAAYLGSDAALLEG
jgi:ABC-type branched-subunit amino acid transport system ATPase component